MTNEILTASRDNSCRFIYATPENLKKYRLLTSSDHDYTGLIMIDNRDRVIGYGFLDDGFINNVFIEPEYRGLGYGTLIMNKLMEYFKGNRIKVAKTAKDLINFYKKIGFKSYAQDNLNFYLNTCKNVPGLDDIAVPEAENSQNIETSEETKENAKKMIESLLNEGCWNMPHTLAQVNKLKKLMSKPIDAFEVGDQVPSKNDELGIGDDSLYDDIAKYRKEHNYGSKARRDCRKVIQKFIKDTVLPEFDNYSYAKPEGDYEGNKWEDGVKEVFQEIADMDLTEDLLNEVYPHKGESKEDFIKRFMSVTKDEYPDYKQRFAVCMSYWKKKKESLTEDTRTVQITNSKNKGLYKNQKFGKNRFERKRYSKLASTVQQYNSIDMNDFFKRDTLIINIPVTGESNNYTVTIKIEGIVAEMAKNIKSNNNKFEFKTLIQAITKIFNTKDVYTKCTCDDFKYRFAHWNIVHGVSVDDSAHDPGPGAGIANPNDDKGRGCKHILLALSNADWIMKVASVIKNYIYYMEEHNQKAFTKVIFPKMYGLTPEEAKEKGIIPEDVDLATDKNLIDQINQAAKNRGKFQKGSNVNPVYADKLSKDQEKNKEEK